MLEHHGALLRPHPLHPGPGAALPRSGQGCGREHHVPLEKDWKLLPRARCLGLCVQPVLELGRVGVPRDERELGYFPPHIPEGRRAAQGDGAARGWVGRSRLRAVLQGLSCEQETALTCPCDCSACSWPAPGGAEPLRDGQLHPGAAAAAARPRQHQLRVQRPAEGNEPLPRAPPEDSGQPHGERSGCPRAVPIRALLKWKNRPFEQGCPQE